MKVWSQLVIASSIFLYGVCCTISHAATPINLSSKITKIIKTDLPDATVGVTVQDAITGAILYDYHGNKLFLPASTTKLLTAAAALKLLGPNYHYETSLYYNVAALNKGVYTGDVALQFTGDPSFSATTLYSLLQKLSDANIHLIQGDLILDDSLYTGPLLGLGWTWDSTAWYHAAPVAAIIIDRNQFGVTLFPAKKVGAKVNARLEPEYPGAKFITLRSDINAVTLEDSETICQISAVVDEVNNVEIGGCWPLGAQPVHLRLAIKNPRLQAQQLIADALDKLQIKVTGKVKFSAVPTSITKVAHHSSEPLYILLKTILGESNNLYAESLTKTLGAKVFGVGSFKTGTLSVQQTLSAMTGVDFTQTRILDGSGESRYNLLAPMHLSNLLYTMQQDQNLNIHFRNALAMSGMNGSLKKRFIKMTNSADIKAKTGSLSGVSTLTGYFTSKSNRELIITIMINHALEDNALLKQFEEDLCGFIVSQL